MQEANHSDVTARHLTALAVHMRLSLFLYLSGDYAKARESAAKAYNLIKIVQKYLDSCVCNRHSIDLTVDCEAFENGDGTFSIRGSELGDLTLGPFESEEEAELQARRFGLSPKKIQRNGGKHRAHRACESVCEDKSSGNLVGDRNQGVVMPRYSASHESEEDVLDRIRSKSLEEIAKEISILSTGYHRIVNEASALKLKYDITLKRIEGAKAYATH